MRTSGKSQPMAVKHWSFAGLLLTYWCNARCASCYVCAAPGGEGRPRDMSVEDALAFWAGLQSAGPRGCRIHIGGGEPFGRWETLLETVRRARGDGLGPLEAVETNAFWATGDALVRDRLRALDDAGMLRLTISTDPYHQQFVPIERVRLLARVGEEVLGPARVRVRWRDWASDGFDTDALAPADRRRLFAAYVAKGRERLTGRAAAELAGLLPLRPAEAFADNPCSEPLLRSRHVHVDGDGSIYPGTCAGIVLGRVRAAEDVGRIWRELARRFGDPGGGADASAGPEVVALLVAGGPAALLRLAQERGYVPRPDGYADKCHLCWDVRRWLFDSGHFREQLSPECVYLP